MEVIINEIVDPSDLKRFEQQYIEQTKRGVASEKAQFEYAWCLIRSKHEMDMKKGVSLLEDLFRRTNDDTARRDHLFYMAIGYTKIKEYEDALKYTKAILRIEPTNHQALELEKYIKNKMSKEGLVGMAIIGGAALAIGGLVGLGVALSKK